MRVEKERHPYFQSSDVNVATYGRGWKENSVLLLPIRVQGVQRESSELVASHPASQSFMIMYMGKEVFVSM